MLAEVIPHQKMGSCPGRTLNLGVVSGKLSAQTDLGDVPTGRMGNFRRRATSLYQQEELQRLLSDCAPVINDRNHGLTSNIQFWLGCALLLLGLTHAVVTVESVQVHLLTAAVQAAAIPLGVVLTLTFLIQRFAALNHIILCYLLFFSISITSLLGLTQTLTGSHAESPSLLLYGLSFYTASMAFLIFKRSLDYSKVFMVGNPLLLVTGPILTGYRQIGYKKFFSRFKYFFPFIVYGAFLHQTIATPLTNTFELIERTDLVSSLVFALIFELFVYANFCGLSLMVFGVAGILGYRIPLNFRQPFSATNLIDFWKGWHTSLSTVLKALFYNPTKKLYGTPMAVFVVYIASAMWHGVTLNFMLWGAFHAIFFILSMKLLKSGIAVLTVPLMVVGIVVGRMLFADAQTDRLINKLQFRYVDFSVFSDLAKLDQAVLLALITILLIVLAEFFFRKSASFKQRSYKFYRLPKVQFVLMLMTLLLISHTSGLDYAVYGQR